MNLLLDTCTFLWVVLEPARLSTRASQLFTDRANTCALSAVSAWEITVKYGLGKLELTVPPASFVPEQRERHGISPCRFWKRRPTGSPSCLRSTEIRSTGCSSAKQSTWTGRSSRRMRKSAAILASGPNGEVTASPDSPKSCPGQWFATLVHRCGGLLKPPPIPLPGQAPRGRAKGLAGALGGG